MNKTLSYHTSCGHNFSETWFEESAVRLRDAVFRFYQGKIQIPITILGTIFTVCYIAAVYKSIHEHRVSRKFYALLLNRAIGDLTACIVSAMIIFYVLLSSHVSSHIMQVFSTLFIGCFWSAMVSYVALGFLKLYGIARPLHYRDRITVRRTIHLILLSWFAFIVLVFMTLSVSALTKIEYLAVWSGCSVESCLHNMYIVRNSATSFIYLITIVCFVITVILIKRAQRFAKAFHRPAAASSANSSSQTSKTSKTLKHRFRFPLIKLTINVLTFAVFHLPYTLWATFLAFADGCFYLLHYNKMQVFMGFIRVTLLLRITLDSVISFATDKELRVALYSIFGYSGSGVAPRSISTTFRSSVSVGEISSDCGRNSHSTKVVSARARAMRSNTISTTLDDPNCNGIQRAKSERSNVTESDDSSVNIDPTFTEVDFKTSS